MGSSNKKQYYAVAKGRNAGIYRTWDETARQVLGFTNAVFKGFVTLSEAQQFFDTHNNQPTGDNQLELVATEGRKRQVETQQPSTSQPLPHHNLSLVLNFDGASRGNPGLASFGALLVDQSSTAITIPVWTASEFMGPRHTNNEAEFAGLIAGLGAALRLGCDDITAVGDSNLVIKAMMGTNRIQSERLKKYYDSAAALKKKFKKFHARHIDRAYNSAADKLANLALDSLVHVADVSTAPRWTLDSFNASVNDLLPVEEKKEAQEINTISNSEDDGSKPKKKRRKKEKKEEAEELGGSSLLPKS
jgi:ribonuclease HI